MPGSRRPPTVCTASCCTTPSTGAVSSCSLVRCSALITSWARPPPSVPPLPARRKSVRRYSAVGLARVSVERRDRRLGFLVAALSGREDPAAARPDAEVGKIVIFEPEFLSNRYLRISTRCCSSGIVASSFAMVAATVARSASFCASWRSISASLAFCSAIWLTQKLPLHRR